jgi:hypothetical protein
MTRDAGDPRVSLCPAPAVLQTIGREPDVEFATGNHLARDYVLPGAVTRATKINVLHTTQMTGIEH